MRYFGEDLKDNTPDVFFGIFFQFQQQLEVCFVVIGWLLGWFFLKHSAVLLLQKAGADNKLEIERVKLAEKKKVQAEDAKKKKLKPRGNAAIDESRNVMDDLITSIRSGAVFDRAEDKLPAKTNRDRKNSSLTPELKMRP